MRRMALGLWVVLSLLLGVWLPARAASAHLGFFPETLEIAPGQTGEVAVRVRGVENLYGFDITLTYDPAVIEIVDRDANASGTQVSVGAFMENALVVRNTVDAAQGRIQLALTQMAPAEPRDGDGLLVVIGFKALAVGDAKLAIAAATLASSLGEEIVNQVEDTESLQVATPAPAAGATPTVTPTALPVQPTDQVVLVPTAEDAEPTATDASASAASAASAPATATPTAPAVSGAARATATAEGTPDTVAFKVKPGVGAPTPTATVPPAQDGQDESHSPVETLQPTATQAGAMEESLPWQWVAMGWLVLGSAVLGVMGWRLGRRGA